MRISKGSLRRAERTAEVKATDWNTYSIHDTGAVRKRLAVQHKAKRDVAKKLGLPVPDDRDFAIAYARNLIRIGRFLGRFGKYMPHQGDKECSRRVRQGVNYGL